MKNFTRSTVTALTLAFATALVAAPAAAQATCGAQASGTASCSPSGVNISTTVQRIVRMSITPAAGSLSAPAESDFAAGGTVTKTDLAMHSLVIRANVGWQVTLQGGAWTAPYAKPIGDVQWTQNGGGAWSAMSSTATSLQSGTATAGTTVNVGYRTTWALENDAPGSYTMPLTFTISST